MGVFQTSSNRKTFYFYSGELERKKKEKKKFCDRDIVCWIMGIVGLT